MEDGMDDYLYDIEENIRKIFDSYDESAQEDAAT